MARIQDTIEELARMQRDWQDVLPGGPFGFRPAGANPSGRETQLTEVSDFGSNPGRLRMKVFVPVRLPPGAALVVALHGCTQDAEGYDRGTEWSALAERFGFMVLLPEQRRENNPKSCFSWFSRTDTTRGRGEALSIVQMVRQLIDRHGLDQSRVFVTGLSAGGAMAASLLATYPDVFAAGGIVAGLPHGAASNVGEAFDSMARGRGRTSREWGDLVRAASPHSGPWPRISIWQGEADRTVAPANAHDLAAQWLDVHGLTAEGGADEALEGHRRRVWRDRAGRPLVELVSVRGMAHGLPVSGAHGSGHGTPGPFFLDVGISSSMLLAEFFGLASSTLHVEEDRTRASDPGPADRSGSQGTAGSASGRPAGTGAREYPAVSKIGETIARSLRAAGLMD